ncbi:hypothetical protein HF846_17185 [Clostridium cadaveris]|uniref:hypothetical protein n=1 Tax=Clostridium cadaveris TaxID=1529 RepID=UPI001459B929|nr:hypothetical protein [Clostridium cadaveris]NME66309.1 hypothetical protein [Clostridium cadaveris]
MKESRKKREWALLKITTDRKMNIISETIVGKIEEPDLEPLSKYLAEKYLEFVKEEENLKFIKELEAKNEEA